ncbi:MAG TPA: PIN domain-containing protein [Sphingobium sp.]|nr:PIN domain-containing protein [Sphingobium sp.]
MTEALFDTGILLDALRGLPAAAAELENCKRRFISRITCIELMAQALPDDGDRIERFLRHFQIVELSEEIARRAAMLMSQRRAFPLASAIVLASAQLSGRILVTRNAQIFPANMLGIRVPYKLQSAEA